jgi:nitrite reductase/ring-hydroxylating ferredoxin subunit
MQCHPGETDMSELFPKDNWYAITGARMLDAGTVAPARLFGEERVLWRGEDGVSHVWHNRCIHRGMRLQYGFVDQNRLSCRYHGWRFAGDGKCAYIPAHPHMTPPDDFCIQAYPSAEHTGLIWTTTGKPDGQPSALSDIENLAFCRSIAINAGPETVAGAVSDLHSTRLIAAGVSRASIAADETLVLAIQPVDDEKSQLHLLVSAASADTPGTRRRYSTWARNFRWQIENAITAEPTPQTAT